MQQGHRHLHHLIEREHRKDPANHLSMILRNPQEILWRQSQQDEATSELWKGSVLVH